MALGRGMPGEHARAPRDGEVGWSRDSWSTTPIRARSARRRVAGRPRAPRRPRRRARRNPSRISTVVVLPAPFGPSSPNTSPVADLEADASHRLVPPVALLEPADARFRARRTRGRPRAPSSRPGEPGSGPRSPRWRSGCSPAGARRPTTVAPRPATTAAQVLEHRPPGARRGSVLTPARRSRARSPLRSGARAPTGLVRTRTGGSRSAARRSPSAPRLRRGPLRSARAARPAHPSAALACRHT